MAKTDNIEPLIKEAINGLGYEFVELKFINAGSHSVLRIFIDNSEGISVDDCQKVSKTVSEILDQKDFSKSPYTLEISSPGIDRQFTTPSEFRKFIGKSIIVRAKQGKFKNKKFTGILSECDDNKIVLSRKKEIQVILFSEILSGKIEIVF